MSGMIGVICNDSSRYSMFWIHLTALRKPVNTLPGWGVTSDRVVGRNEIVKQALDAGSEWLLFLDDDHVFGPGLLERLLAHNKQIVGGLYLQRMAPFAPTAYTHKDENSVYHPVNLHNHGENDLVQVAGLGTGGMLIRTEVFHKMEPPWFEWGPTTEDLIFCDRVYREGLGPIFCDLGARLGHISPAALWPAHSGEDWEVGFAFTDGFRLTVPIAEPDSE